jgi:protein-disulfide isomerase
MNTSLLRSALLAFPFLLAACGNASADKQGDKPAATAAAGAKTGKVELFPTDMIDGDPNAPVTLIEYASLTCPHCATFNADIIPGIKEKYVETGKLKIVFREFPTAPAQYAVIGSVLARCAAEKAGSAAYFAINDALFRTQHNWIGGPNAKAELVKTISQAGMDEAALDACLERKDLIEIINKNTESGSKTYGVTGTPSFILNGQKMSFKTKEEFEQQIAAAVEKAAS